MVVLASFWKDTSTPERGQQKGICREHVGSTALPSSWIRFSTFFYMAVKVFSALKKWWFF